MSLLNGLSAAGKSVSDFAGEIGLQAQKAELAKQQMELADSLIGARESAGRVQSAGIAEAAQGREFGFRSGESALADQRIAARESAGRQEAGQIAEAAQGRTQTFQSGESEKQRNAPTPEIKNAQWWSKASPEERQAYRSEMMAKAGLPDWMSGSTTTTAPSADSAAAPSPSTGTTDASRNDKALEGLPGPAASIVKGMVEGRIAPPTSMALGKPYWQAMVSKAAEYDPTFDQTTWAGRVATRKDFSAGQAAKAVTAMNTALAHAGTLEEDFAKLGNYGGVATMANGPLNAIGRAFGDARQTKTQQTIDALASEARKVFAASGGGNLTELLEWQKSFPLNGSPDQQKAALTGFVDLLDGRLAALADQYNRGMGKTDDPVSLLQPAARKVYERLTGREPKEATGYQLGKPPVSSGGSDQTPKLPDLPSGFRVIQ